MLRARPALMCPRLCEEFRTFSRGTPATLAPTRKALTQPPAHPAPEKQLTHPWAQDFHQLSRDRKDGEAGVGGPQQRLFLPPLGAPVCWPLNARSIVTSR